MVVVRGDAGIGKSSLLDAAVEDLVASGTTVVRLALSSVEAQLGWAGLRLICDQLGGDLERLPASMRSAIPAAIGRIAGPDVDPAQVAFALAELFTGVADIAPLALVVDDLHWLDAATASALAFAVRATARRPILTILAHRPVELPLDPARLVEPACRTAIDLDGLSTAGVHRLLRERGGVRLGRPDAIRIHSVTGGSPLHTIEIGRLLAGGVALDEALVQPSAYDVMLVRIRQLVPDARAVLLAAALAARPTVELLGDALPGIDVEAALETDAMRGLADLRGGSVQFEHPLVRAAVVADATGVARRKMQRILADLAVDRDERVLLLEAATTRPDAAFAVELDDAATRATDRGDLVQAARFARWAAERTPSDEVHGRVERLLRAAELAAASGDLHVPVELADAAIALDPGPDVQFRAGVTKALTIGNRGETARTLALLDELLDLLAGRPAQCARLHDIRAQALIRNDVLAAYDAARASLAEATSARDTEGIDRARSLADMVGALAGEPVDFDEVEERSERLPLTGAARDWSVSVLSLCDLAASSLRHNVLQLAEYRRLGLVHFEAPTRSRMLADLIALGRYREALDQAEACVDLHEMVGGLSTGTIHADIAFLATLLGHEHRAADARRAAEADLREDEHAIDNVAAMGRFAQLAVVGGAWAEAVEWATRAAELGRRVGFGASGVVAHRTDGVEALVQLGRLDEAEQLLAELEAINARSRLPRGPADSARCRALLAAARAIPRPRWRLAASPRRRTARSTSRSRPAGRCTSSVRRSAVQASGRRLRMRWVAPERCSSASRRRSWSLGSTRSSIVWAPNAPPTPRHSRRRSSRSWISWWRGRATPRSPRRWW